MGLIPPGFEGRLKVPEPEKKEGSFDLNKAYQAAEGIIEKESINPRKLGTPFNQQDVFFDMQYVRDKKGEFARESDQRIEKAHKLSKILEVAIYQQVNKNGWFGPDAHAVLPSEYDDFRNKVDLITEFELRKENVRAHTQVALGIDVTYSHELKRKIHDIQTEIDRDELTTVKYYRSPDGSMVGSLPKVPRVVVGMDEQSAGIVARAWYENNPALKTDPLRDKVLIQIIDQCTAFEAYAKSKGSEEAAVRYRAAKDLFQAVYGQPVTPENRKKFLHDKVLQTLELLIHQLN